MTRNNICNKALIKDRAYFKLTVRDIITVCPIILQCPKNKDNRTLNTLHIFLDFFFEQNAKQVWFDKLPRYIRYLEFVIACLVFPTQPFR